MATRPQPLEALGGVEPEVAASVATAATAVPPSTTDTAAQERFIRPDKSTVHCRGRPDHALGSSAPPMPGRSVAHGRESDQTASNTQAFWGRDAVIAEALSGLAESARNASMSNPPAGYFGGWRGIRARRPSHNNCHGLHF
jgi:hypothetical protein